MFWLEGPAGIGKSAIAETFAETCFADGVLGATLIYSREFGFKDKIRHRFIFPTLAFRLARRYPWFREELLKLLRTDPNVMWGSLCSQVEKLIVGPFEAAQIQTLIVIDGPDAEHQKKLPPYAHILSALFEHRTNSPTSSPHHWSRRREQHRPRILPTVDPPCYESVPTARDRTFFGGQRHQAVSEDSVYRSCQSEAVELPTGLAESTRHRFPLSLGPGMFQFCLDLHHICRAPIWTSSSPDHETLPHPSNFRW